MAISTNCWGTPCNEHPMKSLSTPHYPSQEENMPMAMSSLGTVGNTLGQFLPLRAVRALVP